MTCYNPAHFVTFSTFVSLLTDIVSDLDEILEKYKNKAHVQGGESKLDVVQDGNDNDQSEEEDDVVDEDEKFDNSKRKLRLVLCQADFQNLPLLHPDNRLPEKR